MPSARKSAYRRRGAFKTPGLTGCLFWTPRVDLAECLFLRFKRDCRSIRSDGTRRTASVEYAYAFAIGRNAIGKAGTDGIAGTGHYGRYFRHIFWTFLKSIRIPILASHKACAATLLKDGPASRYFGSWAIGL